MTLMVNPQLGEQVADFACGTGGFLTSAMKLMDSQVKTVEDRELFNRSFFGIEKKALPHLLCVTNMLLHDLDSPRIVHGNALEKNVREYELKDLGTQEHPEDTIKWALAKMLTRMEGKPEI